MIHTIILITLVYAAIRAIFKRKPYQIQLVSQPSAAHDSGSTNSDIRDRISAENLAHAIATFEPWSVSEARYEAERRERGRRGLALYASVALTSQSSRGTVE